jgi:integrase
VAIDEASRSSRPAKSGRPLSRHTLRKRFLTACKSLGLARLKTLTIHHGRHTFISHALAGGRRTLAEVRDAAGHANVSITSAYLHVAVDDDGTVGNLFDYGTPMRQDSRRGRTKGHAASR